MASRHLSVRIALETFDRLERESRRLPVTKSELAKTLLEEGLRMERHPGIMFRRGAAGRRPALAGGPDVWEVIRAHKHLDSAVHERIRQTAEIASIREDEVQTARDYYNEFASEIDGWIEGVEQREPRIDESKERKPRILST
ncbi:MAG: hypothetical protein EA415_06920 [Sphaerobacteraceae bacterium]|nr:MAG: hypothetical protein EA415_06920 [Sphaerobacteraceae bacterium]